MMAGIIVRKGDLTAQNVDAIVNPANSSGLMGGGVAYAIMKAGGRIIEKEAVACAPITVGSAIATTAGKLPCRHVIHAPTMVEPVELIGPANVALACRAALETASDLGVKSLAFPGMGCGVGGLRKSLAASTMVSSILEFGPGFDVYLIGFDDELTEEFRRWSSALSREKK